MTEAQDQDNDFFIDDIVDNAIVSNADAQFSFATDKLNAPSRARFFCELSPDSPMVVPETSR